MERKHGREGRAPRHTPAALWSHAYARTIEPLTAARTQEWLCEVYEAGIPLEQGFGYLGDDKILQNLLSGPELHFSLVQPYTVHTFPINVTIVTE